MSSNYFNDLAVDLKVNGYAPLPISPREKYPGNHQGHPMKGWRTFDISDETFEGAPEFQGCGVGLRFEGGAIGLDIDVTDHDAAAGLKVLAKETFGRGVPLRKGRKPKLDMMLSEKHNKN